MKLLADFLPILLFFVAYKMYDIYVATAVVIAATFLQVLFTWLKSRKVAKMQLITLGVLVLFGGLTLYLHDEQFIKWKPTVINWLFGAGFLGSHLFGKKTVVEHLMGSQIQMPTAIWRRLNLGWVAFFLFMGGANLFVMYNFDRDTWVNFKLFGMLGLTMVFLVVQSLYLSRYITVVEKDGEGK